MDEMSDRPAGAPGGDDSLAPAELQSRALRGLRWTVIGRPATVLVRVGASIAMAVAGMGAFALVLGALAGEVATGALAWACAPAPAPRLRRSSVRDLWSYGRPASLAAASWVGFRNCDYAIVAARLGALQAGLYFRAYSIGVEYQKKVSKIMTTV